MINLSSAPYSIAFTKEIAGAPITITRPNNITAYAAGQVYGPAVDARISFVAPALPVDAFVTGFNLIRIFGVQQRTPADPALTLTLQGFAGLPATVIGDQAAFNLSDADIATFGGTSAGQFTWATGVGGTGALNQSANPNGRRFAFSSLSTLGPGFPFLFPPGATCGAYLITQAAYTPLASEVVVLTPMWAYNSRL